jgi:hypothetical protein
MNEFWMQYGTAIATALFWLVTFGIVVITIIRKNGNKS